MTTENVTETPQGTPETAPVQKTTEEVFYGKAEDNATTTVTQAPEPGKTDEVKVSEAPKTESEYVVKLPDDAVLAPEIAQEFAKYAKEKGLAQEVAQEIMDKQNTMVSQFAKAQQDQIQNEINQWADQARLDKEVGGDSFKENVELAKRVIDKFGTKELKGMLERGMGNHPEAIRIFARIGKEFFKDDEMVQPKVGAKTVLSTEELFYGSKQ
jgi:hypothetical protein